MKADAKRRTVRVARGPLLGAVLTLLAVLAAPPDAAAQGAPAGGAVNAWKEINQKADQGNAERQREADRLFDEDRARRDSERVNKLRAALDKRQALLEQPHQQLARLFQLPAALKLSAENRALAEATLQAQRARAEALWPAWRQQVMARVSAKAGDDNADAEQVVLQLSARVLNEAALWFGDAEPHASDAVWIDALQREGLCQGVAGIEPAAQVAALIEALPADRRGTAWAGEEARLSRWGQETRTLLPPAERTLEDSLVPALQPSALNQTLAGMPAALRAELQTPGWSLDGQSASQRCELLRWWSQKQVRLKRLSPRQAMLAWRTALAPRSADHLLTAQARSGAEALGANGYPRVADSLRLSGKVVVEQDVDASGKVLHAFVQRRELRAAILGNQVPLGLERELDRATLDRVAAMPATPPDPASLREGAATRRVAIEWVLN